MRRLSKSCAWLGVLCLLYGCAQPAELTGAVAKTTHSPSEQTARLNDMIGTLSALCIDGLDGAALAATMTEDGFRPFHRKTKEPLQNASDAPVVWRKRFQGGHAGSLSISNSNGLCSGLYQNAAFDQQSPKTGLAAGVQTIRRFAEAHGYTPAAENTAIRLYDRQPAAAFGQYEGPKGRLSIMIGYSPGEQVIADDSLVTRLGGIRFLLVAEGQHI